MLASKIIGWCDKQFEEALDTEDNRKRIPKTVVSGLVTGLVDGFLIFGAVMYFASVLGKVHFVSKK